MENKTNIIPIEKELTTKDYRLCIQYIKRSRT